MKNHIDIDWKSPIDFERSKNALIKKIQEIIEELKKEIQVLEKEQNKIREGIKFEPLECYFENQRT